MWRKTALIALLLASAEAFAESDDEFNQMYLAAVSAFQCGKVASMSATEDSGTSKDSPVKNRFYLSEAKRVLDFGHSQGKSFLAAVEARRARGESVFVGVTPVELPTLLKESDSAFMSNQEFVLGRIYQRAISSMKSPGTSWSQMYQSSNCHLIGRE